MVTIREEDQFRRPVPQKLKAGDQRSRFSHCSVCMRKPPETLHLQEILGDYDFDYANDQEEKILKPVQKRLWKIIKTIKSFPIEWYDIIKLSTINTG